LSFRLSPYTAQNRKIRANISALLVYKNFRIGQVFMVQHTKQTPVQSPFSERVPISTRGQCGLLRGPKQGSISLGDSLYCLKIRFRQFIPVGTHRTRYNPPNRVWKYREKKESKPQRSGR
jgi:hypothetical protein